MPRTVRVGSAATAAHTTGEDDMPNEDKAGNTVHSAHGAAKGVLFVAEGNAIPPVPDNIEVVVVNAAVIGAQVQRRT